MLKRLPSFDAVTDKRLPVLTALKEREGLDCGEVSVRTGLSRKAAYWHLKILAKAGLAKERVTRKHNFSSRAKRKTRNIVRYSLEKKGLQAIEFFS